MQRPLRVSGSAVGPTTADTCGAEAADPSGPGTGPGTVVHPVEETDTSTRADRPWNVIVWNDPINLMSYVTFVFQKLFGYSLEKATQLMLQVHHEGRSIVASVERERAEFYVIRLHEYGLLASLEKAGD